jgi:hypothetical protein
MGGNDILNSWKIYHDTKRYCVFTVDRLILFILLIFFLFQFYLIFDLLRIEFYNLFRFDLYWFWWLNSFSFNFIFIFQYLICWEFIFIICFNLFFIGLSKSCDQGYEFSGLILVGSFFFFQFYHSTFHWLWLFFLIYFFP